MSKIQPEASVRSEIAYEGKFLTVQSDTVRTGRGALATREFLLHPPVVVMVPLTKEDEILLVRQYRKAIERETLELPAGGVEPGESIEDAVRREMLEETGFVPGTLEKLGTIYPSPGISNEIMHIYVVSDLSGSGEPTEPEDELRVYPVSRAQAVDMALGGGIADGKSVIGILMLKSSSQHNEAREGM